MHLPVDPINLLLEMHPTGMPALMERLFFAAPSVMTKEWKQPKHPSREHWLHQLW